MELHSNILFLKEHEDDVWMLAPKQAEKKNVCYEGPRNDPKSYFPCQELKIIMRFVFCIWGSLLSSGLGEKTWDIIFSDFTHMWGEENIEAAPGAFFSLQNTALASTGETQEQAFWENK